MKIKLVSGWGHPGGSTVAQINLTNAFNKAGFDATFYAPNEWHLDKCKAATPKEFDIHDEKAAVLWHFCEPNPGILKKGFHVFSCRETKLCNLRELKKVNYLENFKFVHFVSNSQKIWHSVNTPSCIIPEVISKLEKNNFSPMNAGIIGSIDRHKQTHQSIQRALAAEKHPKIFLYGVVSDQSYFEGIIKNMLSDKVILMGHMDDKQKMYDTVGTVYHSSKSETFNFIKPECAMAGVEYNGLPSAESGAIYLEEEEVVERWVKVLNL